MNQHKDLLYRQKYATYQLNNRTFSTQNTKISVRSLAISYIYFQVRIVKKKRGGSHTINYYGNSGDSRTPDPRQGLYTRNCNGKKLHFLSLLTTILKALICWKHESFRGLRPRQGLCPCTPPGALRRAPWTPPVWGARLRAHGFFRPPPFLQILDPPLYTSPLARPSRLPPEASFLGELGSSRPAPPPQ